jgi:protocatechuate 3,4-dioxygenase beta subunit
MNAAFRSASVALATHLVIAATVTAQVPPRDAAPASQQKPAVGTAVISGSVMMAGSTQPARKVRVSLSAAELRGGRTAITDDQGGFSFTALPAGRYNLSANKPGHVTVTYGQRRPGRPGTPIQLADGQKFRADLQIPKGSVITGTVLDENGEAAPQTQVRIMRVVVQNGRRTLQSSNSSSTDDRGIYRAFGLLPGDYVVCATPRNNMIRDVERTIIEVEALQREMRANVSEQAVAIAERMRELQAAIPPDAADDPAPGYAPICYPGTTPSAATPVTLAVSEERPGIDFQLQLAPLARVEGTVVNSTGADIREINVMLTDAQQTGLSMATLNARADSAGRFRLMNVPPGQYRLTARATIAPPRAQTPPAAGGGRGRGAIQFVSRPEPITVWAATDISVDGRNVSNVLLALQQGVSVSGQIAFEGAAPAPTDLTRIRVTMSPSERTPFGGNASARVDASGRFTIPSVVPGQYRLTASGASGWSVESAVVGGQDALDFPIEIKGNQAVSGAVVTFSDRHTELTGIVTDDKNQPAPEFTLVVFPADSRYWTGPARRIQSTRPATDGRYTFRNLPAGEYRVAPVYDLEPGATSDPAFLQQLEASSLRVTLQPGETKTQDMRIGGAQN